MGSDLVLHAAVHTPFGVALNGQINQARDEFGIVHACRFPELREHRDGREAWHRVDFVQQESPPVFFVEEVDAS